MNKYLRSGRVVVATLVCGLSLLAVAGPAAAQEAGRAGHFSARLDGFQQVPSILTNGRGTFTADLDRAGTSLRYQLRYDGLSGAAAMAHIHFGQSATNGGVIVPLCGGTQGPACPPVGQPLEGTLTAANVAALAAQGVAANDFGGLVRALRSGDTYVNVHTAKFGEGEIRGQVGSRGADAAMSSPDMPDMPGMNTMDDGN